MLRRSRARKQERATAAAAMYRLTGDTTYQDIFRSLTPFAAGPQRLVCLHEDFCDAAWLFARTEFDSVDRQLQEHVIDSFRMTGDDVLAAAGKTSFQWSLEYPDIPLVWGLGPSTPQVTGLLRAYVLLGDPAYRAGALRSGTFSLGANPQNTTYLTGLGEHNPQHPHVSDSVNGNLPAWPGTPVNGLQQLNATADDSDFIERVLGGAGAMSSGWDLPYLSSWFDMPSNVSMSEFAVYRNHTEALFAYGVLAAVNP
mgnify:CR=1 FL=1